MEGEQAAGLFLLAALALLVGGGGGPVRGLVPFEAGRERVERSGEIGQVAGPPAEVGARVKSPAARRWVVRASARSFRRTSTSTPIQATAIPRTAASASSSASVGASPSCAIETMVARTSAGGTTRTAARRIGVRMELSRRPSARITR